MVWGNETERERNEAETKRFYEGLVKLHGKTKQNGKETEQKRSNLMKGLANGVGNGAERERKERKQEEAVL